MTAVSLRAFALAAALLASRALLSAQTPQQKAWDILQVGAHEKSSDKRSRAVSVLGLLPHDPKGIEIAENSLKDEKPQVRVAGATALGQMLSKASIPRLKDALSDQEPSVVLAAAHSLLLLKDKDAYEVYYAVLKGERKSSRGLVAEQEKVLKDRKKMAEFGFEEGIGFVPFAGLGYSAVKALAKDDTSPVRAAAAKVLASDPDPRSGRALAQAVTDKSWIVRVAALDAIAKRGDPSLLNDILPAMSDGHLLVRYTAAAAAIRLSTVQPGSKGKKRH